MTIDAQPTGLTQPATDGDVIRTVGLTKVFEGRGGQVRAVETLDLPVHRGEIFGLLGPNGAGKTTTVGMLTTRVIPTAGEALVGGDRRRRAPGHRQAGHRRRRRRRTRSTARSTSPRTSSSTAVTSA